MVKIRKYTNGIERFLHGEKGQRFFNFAYSIGAAIVIWGALFKILHLPGGSTLLSIGMGTEIAMFILTAFDRPPKEYHWEDVFPVLDTRNPDDRPNLAGGAGIPGGVVINGVPFDSDAASTETYDGEGLSAGAVAENSSLSVAAAASAGATPSVGGILPAGTEITAEEAETLRDSIRRMAEAGEQMARMGDLAEATGAYMEQMQGIAAQMEELRRTTAALNEVTATLLTSYRAITDNSGEISQSAEGYAERLGDLNRNISGLNTIYEIQLKSVSSQLETVDRVNRGLKDIRDMYEKSAAESSRYCEETEKMARYMKQLNSVYEKMITAMTINMYNPMMGGQAPANPFAPSDDKENS